MGKRTPKIQIFVPQDIPQAEEFPIDSEIPPPRTRAARRLERKIRHGAVRETSKMAPQYRMNPLRTHLYVVSGPGGLHKIGSAFDIQLRLEGLQAQSPVQLHLRSWVLWGGHFERRLHRMFKQRWSHGEWFEVSHDEIKAAIAALVEEARAARSRK